MLEITNLASGYNGASVLRNVSLSVAPGEIVAVLGANGAGKTTLLSTIYGVLRPMEGDVRLNDTSMVGRAPHQNLAGGMGYVPEGRALAPSLTVLENLRLISSWKVDPFELFPELTPLRARRVGLLSGGEQQMLAVARGLISGPDIVLVDELSFGLAPILVTRLLARLRSLADSNQLGVLLVEQRVHDALAVADRALVLVRGDVVLDGPADELLEGPERLAASYLG